MRRILIFDTSVLCCLIQVAGKETAGSGEELWDFARITALIEHEVDRRSTFVLPLASIIETGNHIAQAPRDRFRAARALADIIHQSALASTPWAAFTDQNDLWGSARLVRLAEDWPDLAKGGLTIGDATIKDVAEYYANGGFEVEIVSSDHHLRAYRSAKDLPTPRRRPNKLR